MERLKNRVAIITGGGTGIGKAIALAFASEGAKVVIASRTLSNLEKVSTEIKSRGGQAIAIQADVTDDNQVKEMIDHVLNNYRRIDILVNNSASRGKSSNLINMTVSEWLEELTTDLVGTMICTREVLKLMITQKSGNIINIGSVAGMYGVPGRSAYSASKWGIIGLTETLAIEVGEYNIRVNCISPAATRTERFEEAHRRRAEALSIPYEEVIRNMLKHYALKRIPEPSEVATAALFLASDEASAITGHNLVVSCGFHPEHP